MWLEKRHGGAYRICWRDTSGQTHRRKAYRDKAASLAKQVELEKRLARGDVDLLDPYKAAKALPLASHLADYAADLAARGRDAKYIENVGNRLKRLAAACGWERIGKIDADSFCRWRETITKAADGTPTIGPTTQNQFLETARSFCTWAVKRHRLPANPLADVDKVQEGIDLRRQRRAWHPDEIQRLLSIASEPASLAYRTILATGLRRAELRSMVWDDVHEAATAPYLRLRAAVSKNGKAAELPLRLDLAAELHRLRGDNAGTAKVFRVPTMRTHIRYLRKAKIAYLDADGRRADLHSLRHTFGTMLSATGTHPREAMALMRHSDLRLTMATYTDARIFDLAAAVAKLPSMTPTPQTETAVATGTDNLPITDSCDFAGSKTGSNYSLSSSFIGTQRLDEPKAGSAESPGKTSDSALIGTQSHDVDFNGRGRIRTYEGRRPSDLQSDAFVHFATRPQAG
jgi:integrase